jgi:hypothetical protein
MNLPEYRRALSQACEAFKEDVESAGVRLAKALAVADTEFHEDQSEMKTARPRD